MLLLKIPLPRAPGEFEVDEKEREVIVVQFRSELLFLFASHRVGSSSFDG